MCDLIPSSVWGPCCPSPSTKSPPLPSPAGRFIANGQMSLNELGKCCQPSSARSFPFSTCLSRGGCGVRGWLPCPRQLPAISYTYGGRPADRAAEQTVYTRSARVSEETSWLLPRPAPQSRSPESLPNGAATLVGPHSSLFPRGYECGRVSIRCMCRS